MASPFDALVLAGGAGRRMGDPHGTDKAALDVGGVTLLDRVLAAVAGAQRCVVVGPRRPTARVVTFTVEEPPGSGPAAAIVHGLSLVDARTILVLATDMPFAATAVPKLLDALTGEQVDAAMLVDDSGRRQPLVAAYRADALRRCAEGRDWRGASVRALISGLKVAEVAAVGDEALDCDTPVQLTAAQQAASSQPTG
jgi:molybdopterin-guanine dinucleotide biosynthesis protein A